MRIADVDAIFIRHLRQRYMGYGTTTTRAILDHLYATNVKISSDDLQDNKARLRAPYDTKLPIKTLINQVEGTIKYAAAGNTLYTPLQVVGIAYQLIFQTGMFTDDCKQCKRRDPADKTWTEIKIFSSTAHQELRKFQATTAGAGYHAANLVDHQAANQLYQQEIFYAIANLAAATARDHASVATLTTTNSNLAAALTLSNNKLVTNLQDVARLTGTIAELRRKTGYQSTVTAPEVGWAKRHYFGTSGYACEHSIHNCPRPATGHQKGAYRFKRLGGSTKSHPR